MKDLLQRLIAEGKVEVVSLADVFDKAPTHDEITSKSLEEFLYALGKSHSVLVNTELDKDEIDRAKKAFDIINRNQQGEELLKAYLGEDFMNTINNVVDNIQKSSMGTPNVYLQSQRKEEPKSKLDEHSLLALTEMMAELDCIIRGVTTDTMSPFKSFFNLLLVMYNRYGKNIHDVVYNLNNSIIQEAKELKVILDAEELVKMRNSISRHITKNIRTHYLFVLGRTKATLVDVYPTAEEYNEAVAKVVKAKLKNKLWDFNINAEFSDLIHNLTLVVEDNFTRLNKYTETINAIHKVIENYDKDAIIKYYNYMEASK